MAVDRVRVVSGHTEPGCEGGLGCRTSQCSVGRGWVKTDDRDARIWPGCSPWCDHRCWGAREEIEAVRRIWWRAP